MIAFFLASAPPASNAGIVTSVASVITALALLLTSIGVIIPQMRRLHQENIINSGKLDEIHALANSTLTIALEAELEANKQALASMEELVAVQVEAGKDVRPETSVIIASYKVKINHLETRLMERALADRLAKEALDNP